MTYRGVVSNGVVLLEGDKPSDGTVVEVIPVGEVAAAGENPAGHRCDRDVEGP